MGRANNAYEQYLIFRERKPHADPAEGVRLYGIPLEDILRWDSGVQSQESIDIEMPETSDKPMNRLVSSVYNSLTALRRAAESGDKSRVQLLSTYIRDGAKFIELVHKIESEMAANATRDEFQGESEERDTESAEFYRLISQKIK